MLAGIPFDGTEAVILAGTGELPGGLAVERVTDYASEWVQPNRPRSGLCIREVTVLERLVRFVRQSQIGGVS